MAKKNAAAVALGRLGGAKKVPKGFATMDQDAQHALAVKGVAARKAKAKKRAARK